MKNLLADKIIRSLITSLDERDIKSLETRRSNQLFAAIIIYIAIILFFIVYWNANTEGMSLDTKSFRINFSGSETENYQKAIPFLCLGALLISSFLFIKFILKKIIPLTNSLREGKKLLVYFKPEKSARKIKKIYYLDVPFYKGNSIELTKEQHEQIGNKEELCLEMTPDALQFISLTKNSRVIKHF